MLILPFRRKKPYFSSGNTPFHKYFLQKNPISRKRVLIRQEEEKEYGSSYEGTA
jgi:hypothetical protein